MKAAGDARCHHAIAAFVDQRTSAADFVRGFRHLSGGEVADPALDDLLGKIRELCDCYARSLVPGADYRVSEERFRVEVGHVAGHHPANLPHAATTTTTHPRAPR